MKSLKIIAITMFFYFASYAHAEVENLNTIQPKCVNNLIGKVSSEKLNALIEKAKDYAANDPRRKYLNLVIAAYQSGGLIEKVTAITGTFSKLVRIKDIDENFNITWDSGEDEGTTSFELRGTMIAFDQVNALKEAIAIVETWPASSDFFRVFKKLLFYKDNGKRVSIGMMKRGELAQIMLFRPTIIGLDNNRNAVRGSDVIVRLKYANGLEVEESLLHRKVESIVPE